MGGWPMGPDDQRQARRRAERRLMLTTVIVFLLIAVIVIGVIYGWSALLSGLLCLLPGMIALVLLWLLLQLLERLGDRWR
ncbi:MAG: hypothetical protein ACP5HG_01950 [Anaerolineae bacterium]